MGWVPGGWENTVNNVFAAAIKTDTGYDVEVFIPWADLALTQPPRAMAVSFGTVNWDGKVKNDGGRDIVWSGIGKDPQVPNQLHSADQGRHNGRTAGGSPSRNRYGRRVE